MIKDKVIEFSKKKNVISDTNRGYVLYTEGLSFYRKNDFIRALEKFTQAYENGYVSADMFSFISRIWLGAGDIEKVEKYARMAIDVDDKYGFAYYMIAEAYADKDVAEALKYHLLAEKYGFVHATMYREIANEYLCEQNSLKSIEYATKAIKLNPDDAYSWYWKGYVYDVLDEPSKSLKYYLKAQDMGYSDFGLFDSISSAYMNLRNYKDALEYANKCIFMEKDNPRGYYLKGSAYQALENYEKSEKYLLKAEELNSDDADVYLHLASTYGLKKQYEKALFYTEKALLYDENYAFVYITKGNILFLLYNSPSKAIKFYKKAYSIRGSFVEDEYTTLVSFYSLANKYKIALKVVDNALKLFPDSYSLLASKMSVLIQKKEYNSADKILKKLTKIEPNNEWNDYYYALSYYNCEKSKKDIRKAIDLILKISNPEIIEDGEVKGILSVLYYDIRDYKKSIEYLYDFLAEKSPIGFICANEKTVKKYINKLIKKFPNDEKLIFLLEKFPQLSKK